MTHTAIWYEGYRAFQNGKPHSSNPYGGWQATQWRQGWDAAKQWADKHAAIRSWLARG
jgi:hypothetical protein